jgi:hypothetical protein
VENGEADVPKRNLSKLQSLWHNRDYIIVDEVSMMDCMLMERFHKRLSMMRNRPNEMFGGVNVIFVGDFLQFPSISGLDMWRSQGRCEEGHRR